MRMRARCESPGIPLVLVAALLAVGARAQGPGFTERHRLTPSEARIDLRVLTTDVDGDGDVDVLWSDFAGQVSLDRNDGHGRFETTDVFTLPSTSRDLALGDVDGDGVLDLVTAGVPQVLTGSATGGFTAAPGAFSPPPVATGEVSLGDLDGDGDLDVVFGGAGSLFGGVVPPVLIQIYLNDGTGSFLPGPAQGATLTVTGPTAVGDVDADGDLDIVGPAFLFLNTGPAVFTDASATMPAVTGDVRSIDLFDFDGDGFLDVYFCRWGATNLLFQSLGGFFIDVSNLLPAHPELSTEAAIGDVNGDGAPDILVVNEAGRANRLYLGSPSGTFTHATTALPEVTWAAGDLGLADVDGDGDLDVLVATRDAQPNRLLLNDGFGRFTDVSGDSLPRRFTSDAALFDIDGDGDLDYVTVGAGVTVSRNDAGGRFTAGSVDDGRFGIALAAADFDGDGDRDLVVARSAGFAQPADLALFVNDGTGGFRIATGALPPLPNAASALAPGDVDGDGDCDLVVGFGAHLSPVVGRQTLLFLNDGTGTFADSSAWLPQRATNTLSLALADLDGDGDLDLIQGNGASQLTFFPVGQFDDVYTNDGGGRFSSAGILPASFGTTRDVQLGDVDGDGDLDALTVGNATFFLSFDQLHLNDGTGQFTDVSATALPTAAAFTSSSALFADVDRDGDCDIILSRPTEGLLLLNDGTGAFTSGPPIVTAAAVDGMLIGDLDRDGDDDLVLASSSGLDRVLFGTTRHLAWRDLPRPGRPLGWELRGAPGSPWTLLVSSGRADLPAPPFGVSALDLTPGNVLVAATGFLDATGRATPTFAVPASPALIGITAWWQALLAAPLHFTGFETTTFANL